MSDTEKLGYGYKVTPRVVTSKVTPLRDGIIVEEMKFGMQTTSKGLIILNDDGANHGIKPRWGRVYSVGPDQKDVKVGQYILVEHGRWTRGIEVVDPSTGEETVIRKVDNENILMVSDETMTDMAYSNITGA
uniref:Co-chaperonin GroES n=1 Tax=uncultured virus TaxID=340016 RepID=A0A221S367_9VIRU|nr:co-chaperonin GroES [uncultured virus]